MSAGPSAREQAPFTEKSFYLGEFRGRTLAFAASGEALRHSGPLESVLKELEANSTDVVLLSDDCGALATRLGAPRLEAGEPGLPGRIWRALGASPRVAVDVGAAAGLVPACHDVALQLGVMKLVWLDVGGGLARTDGSRASFVDLEALGGLSAGPRQPLLDGIEAVLRAGLPAVNLCTPEGLADELFSYAGSGTLFTRDHYVEVRRLTLDDFSAAHALLDRGVSEGYLLPRGADQLDEIFAHGHGAFVEGQHLAGIAALLRHGNVGEIASLYTLTRFLGEGVGGHLVQALCEQARRRGDVSIFACTLTERVVRFFERQGFLAVTADALPESKWRGYEPSRRDRVVCLEQRLD